MENIEFTIAERLKYFNKFVESCGESEPDYEKSWGNGWNSCKEKILEILLDQSNQINRFTYEEFAYMSGIDPIKVVEKINKL